MAAAARLPGLEREKSPNQRKSHSRRDPSPTLPLLGMFSPRSSYNNPDDPLTAALLGSIPRDETPAQRQQRLALEAEARRISDEIDERLRQERIDRGRKKVVKVLLLGRSSHPSHFNQLQIASIHSRSNPPMHLTRSNALYPFV